MRLAPAAVRGVDEALAGIIKCVHFLRVCPCVSVALSSAAVGRIYLALEASNSLDEASKCLNEAFLIASLRSLIASVALIP